MASIPEDSDSEPSSPVLSTPPRWQPHSVSDRPHGRDDVYHSDLSTTHQSRPASPSWGPDSLEMSPLPPFRDEFPTPSLPPSSPLYPHLDATHPNPDRGIDEDITQDSRVVLAQRLNRLLYKISRDDVEDETILTLHVKVDELEDVLQLCDKPPKAREDNHDGTNPTWELPPPGSLLPSDASSLASSKHSSAAPIAKSSVDRQTDIVSKLESPTSRLTVAESVKIAEEHIHALLITKLEHAAQRIVELEEQLRELERERKQSDTELLNLQIQLKAIEVQLMNYMPQGADDELSESINAWKQEFSALKQKRPRMRQSSGTPTGTPTRRRVAG
ncbi:hypothetical protein NPX13_g8910 [Xylaria arbuscula]|uniref:Uncharacterized protein n=1 Tax=Xylaria arbuscula TaxID=114810 RepID=A0A9W8N809_9PEZI|nr:hypothetical protein NPX13_g8910 [Xylaria arbuscula]